MNKPRPRSERPIIFSGPMVRAILEGRKTQTRRVVKRNAAGRAERGGRNWHLDDPDAVKACPYGVPGDRLWVRETFRAPRSEPLIYYRADENPKTDGWRWTPAIHLPRKWCRLVLEVTAVRVERLQDISYTDAEAEGVKCDMSARTFVDHYRELWDSLNAKRAPWASNPWVWVIEFRRAA